MQGIGVCVYIEHRVRGSLSKKVQFELREKALSSALSSARQE